MGRGNNNIAASHSSARRSEESPSVDTSTGTPADASAETPADTSPASKSVKLYLDDLRPSPGPEWTYVSTVEDAWAVLVGGNVEVVSLDHDLGLDENDEILPTGRVLVDWMCEHGIFPPQAIVHSDNAPASETMCDLLRHYGGYRRLGRQLSDPRPERARQR